MRVIIPILSNIKVINDLFFKAGICMIFNPPNQLLFGSEWKRGQVTRPVLRGFLNNKEAVPER